MAWVYLFVAAGFEIVWAVGLKSSQGFTKFWPSMLTLAAMAISVSLLSISVRSLPLGTAYAIWTGIGAAGTALCGMLLFGESASAGRLFFLAMILCGIIGLKFLR